MNIKSQKEYGRIDNVIISNKNNNYDIESALNTNSITRDILLD